MIWKETIVNNRPAICEIFWKELLAYYFLIFLEGTRKIAYFQIKPADKPVKFDSTSSRYRNWAIPLSQSIRFRLCQLKVKDVTYCSKWERLTNSRYILLSNFRPKEVCLVFNSQRNSSSTFFDIKQIKENPGLSNAQMARIIFLYREFKETQILFVVAKTVNSCGSVSELFFLLCYFPLILQVLFWTR